MTSIELYISIPVLIILTYFQGHSNIEYVKLQVVFSW